MYPFVLHGLLCRLSCYKEARTYSPLLQKTTCIAVHPDDNFSECSSGIFISANVLPARTLTHSLSHRHLSHTRNEFSRSSADLCTISPAHSRHVSRATNTVPPPPLPEDMLVTDRLSQMLIKRLVPHNLRSATLHVPRPSHNYTRLLVSFCIVLPID